MNNKNNMHRRSTDRLSYPFAVWLLICGLLIGWLSVEFWAQTLSV